MPDTGLAERVERIEAHLAIQQLAIRYAMAVDARDMEAWVRCFRPDVDMGRHGTGREALRRYIDPMVRRFYRSVHQICGHRIELTTQDTATGAVYCRAEHEAGDEWIVMAICYFDEYARVDGEWFFSRRRERHWYAANVTDTPQSKGFAGWSGSGKAGATRRVRFVGEVLGRTKMNLGVWFDLRNPPGWRQDPARLAAFTLELCEEAELLGADSLWFSEHHGFEDGYLPQPLTFAAAAAARTTRVRLGTGILVAPLRKTAQLAEEAAVVDIISGGRLELGLGAGYRVPEFELFGTDFTARYQILDQQVAELRRLWADGGLTPPPTQQRLPIWLGYQGPKGARRAGRMGEGLLTVAASSWPHYRDGLAEGGHDPAAARMAGGVQAYVTEDPERDWPRVAPHIAYAQDSYRRYMVEGTGHPVPRPVDPERLRAHGPEAGPMSYFLFGTPEDVAKAIGEYAGDAPVQTVWLGASVAGLPEDLAARHVQTICTRLRPLLRPLLGPLLKEG